MTALELTLLGLLLLVSFVSIVQELEASEKYWADRRKQDEDKRV
jgi:hypothetical protein